MRKINEEFICEQCGEMNGKAEKTCRNHCVSCLYSKHLDEESPGDRASKCLGLMEPIKIDYSGKKGFMIVHECLQCQKKILNKASPEDSIQVLTRIMNKQNLNG